MYSIENPKVGNLAVFAGNMGAMLESIAESVAGKRKLLEKEAARAFVDEYIHIPAHGSCSKDFEDLLRKHL